MMEVEWIIFIEREIMTHNLWVILSPQVKSLEKWMQGPTSPNCKRAYKDQMDGRIFEGESRDTRTTDFVGIFKGGEGICELPNRSEFLPSPSEIPTE